jgi:uncharacterized repeat protein (TIGR03803 family)
MLFFSYKSWVRKLFSQAKGSATPIQTRRPKRRPLQVEQLEDRWIPSLTSIAGFGTLLTGTNSQAALVKDASGDFFGTTITGGASNLGTVFEIVSGTGISKTIASFAGASNGSAPYGALIIDGSGNLFGTASAGGSAGDGTVFEIASGSGTITTLATFHGTTDGANPHGGLVEDGSGNLYGTATNGGASGAGTVFEVVSGSGTVTTLATFTGANGSNPYAAPIMDGSGNLFGTAQTGGGIGDGTVWEVANGSGTVTTLGTFNGTNGYYPFGGVVEDGSGNLYGAASGGGTSGFGTAYEVVHGSGTITTLANFGGGGGGSPNSDVVRDASGNLYGTAIVGGANNDGSVWEVVSGSGNVTALASFNVTNGKFPKGGLVRDGSGNLFGTTSIGGSANNGVVFEVKSGSGNVTVLANFNAHNSGENALGGTIIDASGNLYGTTYVGGTSNDGTVFEVAHGTGAVTTLATFTGGNGENPQGSLIIDGSGNLYGTTVNGGSGFAGTVFEVAAGSGTITTLATFTGTNGAYPYGGLTRDASGNLYGTTNGGGASGAGTVFEVVNGSGNVTTLGTFTGANGSGPYGNVVRDASGNVYGAAEAGGASGDGTIFKIVSGSGHITTLATFNGSNGANPAGSLIMDASGNLFGTAYDGGASGAGTVFKLANGSGTITTLATFNGTNGSNPYGSLIEDSSGTLYGSTYNGGTGGNGTVFMVLAGSGTVTNIGNFNVTNGLNPQGTLAIDSNYNLFGDTEYGGPAGTGSVFEAPAAATSVEASSQTATFSTGGQSVTLSATVTSTSTVNAGFVTFSVFNGATQIGSSVTSSVVSSGAASASYTLPGGTPVGTYSVHVSFSGGANDAPSNNSADITFPTLTVGQATTSVEAAAQSANFNLASESVTLHATVSSTTGANTNSVNEGVVVFSVWNGATQIGSSTTSGTVAGGAASATYTLPAGTALGTYSIHVSYAATTDYLGSDNSADVTFPALTVNPAVTTVEASAQTATFNVADQMVTLNATVNGGNAGTANGGTVTFSVYSGATQIGVSATSGTVVGGAASATYTLPGGTAAGTYNIQVSYSGSGNFGSSNNSSDVTFPHLTVGVASTTVEATAQTATFSTGGQSVTLSGTVVSSGGDTPSAGTLTFTVFNGATQIGGPATSGTVAGGTASATYTLPGGTAAGTYSIHVSYSGGGNDGGSNNSADVTFPTLTVGQATTTVDAYNEYANFNLADQPVILAAQVSSTTGANTNHVNEGMVVFSVYNGATQIGSSVTSGTAVNGFAFATYTLPGGTALGTYSVHVSFAATADYSGSDNSADVTFPLLTVNPAVTSVEASAQTATFNVGDQSVTLNATVNGGTGGTANGGTVTFGVYSGATQIGSSVTSGTVAGGAASATWTLPGGTAAGTYNIHVSYSGSGNFGNSDNSGDVTFPHLTVGQASTTVEANAQSATFSTGGQSVTLSGTVVSSGGDTPGAGTMTFSVYNGATQIGSPVTSGTVSGGTASATYTLPGGTPAGTYSIHVSYSGGGNDAGSNNSGDVTFPALTVGQAMTSVEATATSASYNVADETVTLHATVSSTTGANTNSVNEGFCIFQVYNDGMGQLGSNTYSGTIVNGLATASFTLPGGTPVGTYSLVVGFTGAADYSDSNNLADAPTYPLLTVNPAATTVEAAAGSATFNVSGQSVTLNATVSSGTGGTPNVGTFTFSVYAGATQIGSSATSGTVAGGSASAMYTLPGGTAAGTYSIHVSYSGGGNLASSNNFSDVTFPALTVNQAPTSVEASAQTATFSTGGQSVTLSGTVMSTGGDTPGAGTLTFSVYNGATQIGSSVTSGTVSGGTASASYTLPGGTVAGTYSIHVSYSGGGNDAGSNNFSDVTFPTLTVGMATTSVEASAQSASFNVAGQSVTLHATVSSTTGANTNQVNEGVVVFSVYNGATQIGSSATSGAVVNGAASATYTLPGGTSVGTYSIHVSFASTADYSGSDNSADVTFPALTVTTASTTVEATSQTATFNVADEPVTLTATVSSANGGTVNNGTVTFTVFNGATQIGSSATSGTVAGGSASATYTLPGGTATGAYTIHVTYSGGGNLAGSNNSGDVTFPILTVGQAATSVEATAQSAIFSASSQPVTLSATVTSGTGGTPNSGTVTFSVYNGATQIGSSVTGSVSGGTASAIYTLPGGTVAGAYSIHVTYSGGGNLAGSNNSGDVTFPTLTVERTSALLDNGQPGYTETAGFIDYSDPNAYNGNEAYAAPGVGANTATWSIPYLAPGSYFVEVTWTAFENRATNATYQIYDGATLLGSVTVDQTQVPTNGVILGGVAFQNFGRVTINSGTLNVVLSDNANNFVIADAVDVVQSTLPAVVDNSQFGYTDAGGGWASYNDANAYLGNERYVAPGVGLNTATWTATGLAAGVYDAQVNWVPYINRADNVTYQVFDGATLLATVQVNQQLAPEFGATVNGVTFQSLGRFTISSGSLKVVVSDNADGYVIADAMLVEQATMPALVDNSQGGYTDAGGGWASFSDTNAYLSNERYVAPGTGSNTATWQAPGIAAGVYDVMVDWTAFENRATNATYQIYDGATLLGTATIDQTKAATGGPTINGIQFQSLGRFQINSGTVRVVLSDNANGYVIADAMLVEAATLPAVVDNSQGGYSDAGGGWVSFNDANAYSGNERYVAPGTGSNTATWQVPGLASGAYNVEVNWTAFAGRATNATYQIYDGATLLATTSIDQTQVASGGVTLNGIPFQSLGRFPITSGTVRVVLSDNANGYVIADAVYVQVATLPTVVDNGQYGYSETGGGWNGFNDPNAYNGNERYAAPGVGANTATWAVPLLPAGSHNVQVDWTPYANRATNATYQIFDGATLVGTVMVDQTQAPTGGSLVNGVQFQSLGTFTINSGTLRVVLSDNANGYVIADAMLVG